MEDNYNDLDELFEEIKSLDFESPEYQILTGKVYDTLRWHVNNDIPDNELADISTMLRNGETESAIENAEKYLDPSEIEVIEY